MLVFRLLLVIKKIMHTFFSQLNNEKFFYELLQQREQEEEEKFMKLDNVCIMNFISRCCHEIFIENILK